MRILFRSSRFSFLVTFGNEVSKIRKYYVIFVYILQGKMDKTEKNGMKITQLKWPKYGMNKTIILFTLVTGNGNIIVIATKKYLKVSRI